jgi:diacylglycerol kinase family enzyme
MRRRLLAALSLVLVPLGVAIVLVGYVLGFPQLFVGTLALLGAGLSGWSAMGRRGVVRFTYGAVVVALVGAAAVLAFFSDRSLVVIVVGVVVVVLGGSAAGTALLHAPRLGGPPPPEPVTVLPQQPVLFVNPRSGDGTAQRTGLVDAARERGVRVVELTAELDLRAAAREAVAEGADCLGAAGGDGTLATVAEVAIECELPFVCVPAGTRNHFALDLGLDRGDPVGGLDAFTEAVERRIDVAQVNGRMFLNNVSVGAYGEVVAEEQYRQRKVGTALAKLPSLIGPEAEPLDLRFTDGGGTAHDSAIVVHVSNNAYELVPRPGFGTRPSLCDGRLGIVAMVHSPGLTGPVRVIRWESPEFELESDSPIAAGLDGEALELESPARFGIRPGALRVWMPVHAIGASPAGRRPRLTRRTVERLRELALGHIPRY